MRRAEHRELRERGDTRLTGSKYAWLRHPDHFSAEAWRAFARLRNSTLKVAPAWALKGAAADLWEYCYVGAARTFFRWYFWAHDREGAHAADAPPNILTYLRHRIINATAEGFNLKIQWIRYTARGFRNRETFKTAIYFHCGDLDLSTLKPEEPNENRRVSPPEPRGAPCLDGLPIFGGHSARVRSAFRGG